MKFNRISATAGTPSGAASVLSAVCGAIGTIGEPGGLYMIVAWRTMMVTMLGRECPDLSCDVMFEEHEWKSVYTIIKKTPAPSEPPPLGEFVSMVAQLGGYLGRKGDGPPGPQTIWIGLQRMGDFALAWLAFRAQEP